MTGPEHYLEAERLIAAAGEQIPGSTHERRLLDHAALHQGMALVAATIDGARLANGRMQEWAQAFRGERSEG